MNTLQKLLQWKLVIFALFISHFAFAQFTVDIQGDSILCPGDTLVLIAQPSEAAEILWHNGATTDTIVLTSPEEVSVMAINANQDTAVFLETILQQQPPSVDIFVSGELQCPNDQVSLTVPASVDIDYEWSTFQTGNVINVGNPGEYWVHASNFCGNASDTVLVPSENRPYPEAIISTDKTDICEGDSTVLRLSVNSEGFWFWSEGFAFVDSIVVDTPGSYWVEFINDCGAVTEFIEITRPPDVTAQINGPTQMCEGETVTLNAISNTALTYQWSDASTEPSFVTGSTGTYTVTVTDKCEERATASVFVQEIPPPTILLTADEPLLCEQDFVQVRADTFWADGLVWDTGETTDIILTSEARDYSVMAFNQCFETTASTFVQTMRVPVFVPNVFSPNNDGENDFFQPFLRCQQVQDFHLQVFSRWGALVFETADFTDWWDGTTNGIQQAASGVYVWIMRFEIRDRNYYFEGDVTLMR